MSCRIDEKVGSRDIADHFASKYQTLYSNSQLGTQFDKLKENIDSNISDHDFEEIMKIDENLVNEALNKMKSGKGDVHFSFSSDCLTNGPKVLLNHLAWLFRIFLVHGRVADILLLCSLVPIVKNNLADLTSSNNYRAIAKSSLILKLFECVVLLREGEKMSCDQLQFGYQRLSSTVMCSWVASSVIDHFNRAGNDVFCALLDCSKAFDMVEWETLFSELISRQISFIFLRVLLFIYSEQKCNVSWNGSQSTKFGVSNGVRQGAVSSSILFGVHLDKLIRMLRVSGIGSSICKHYFGVMVHADNIMLLCPSRIGLQAMMNNCQNFAESHNCKFSTHKDPNKSKTKCIHFSRKALNLACINLDGNQLPWVQSAKHVEIYLKGIIRSAKTLLIEGLHSLLKFIVYSRNFILQTLLSK